MWRVFEELTFWDVVRHLGFVGLLAVFITILARADEQRKPCFGLSNDTDRRSPTADERETLFTDDQCEAAKRREFRVPLFEVPQEGEDPMALSVGAKDRGGILRFKIPFSW